MKRVVVTGGTRGIGKAIVERLILEDYFVYFTYVNSDKEARELEELYHNKCKSAKVDGANTLEVETFINSILQEGTIDTLINNAGISNEALIEDVSWDTFIKVMHSNLGGVFNFSKAIMKSMRRNKYGNIINISSQASFNVRLGNAAYGTSKAAIDRFSNSLSMELARFNIAVNTISPSFVKTDMTNELFEIKKNEIIKQIPSRRLTELIDVTDVVIFLLRRKPVFFGTNIPIGGK